LPGFSKLAACRWSPDQQVIILHTPNPPLLKSNG